MIAFKNETITLLKYILPKILSSAIIYMILLLKPLKKDIKLLTTLIKVSRFTAHCYLNR